VKLKAKLLVRPEDLKMLREDLCWAQSRMAVSPADDRNMHRIQDLINEIDRHRPLDPSGTHGDLHTPTCGCERQR
jgi:hypothetical protein